MLIIFSLHQLYSLLQIISPSCKNILFCIFLCRQLMRLQRIQKEWISNALCKYDFLNFQKFSQSEHNTTCCCSTQQNSIPIPKVYIVYSAIVTTTTTITAPLANPLSIHQHFFFENSPYITRNAFKPTFSLTRYC